MAALSQENLGTLEFTVTAQAIALARAAIIGCYTDQELQPLFEGLAVRIANAHISHNLDILKFIAESIKEMRSLVLSPAAQAVLGVLAVVAGHGSECRPSPLAGIVPNSNRHKFLEMIVLHPGVGMKALIEDLGFSPPLASRIGCALERDGLVRRLREGREVMWYPTKMGTEMLSMLGDS